MYEIAALAAVSKQTVYKHFSTKEALFGGMVSSTSNQANDRVYNGMPGLAEGGNLAEDLRSYAHRQLPVVLTSTGWCTAGTIEWE